jgi:methionyl-tRNA formyltransferase
MNTSSSRSVVSVTLICSAGELIDRLLSAWDRTGQHLRAVVVSETPRRKPLSAPLRRLQRAGVPVLRVDYPVDWEKTGELLAGVPADVLVCYGFMRLIPQAFLNLFPCGGVNFHPALLPAYAGPHPARCLAADGTYGVYGGVTLHRMTEAFDEGTVLARSKFLTEDYRSARRFRDVLAETMAAMIRDVLPLHCAGRVREEGQEGAVRTWARYHPRCVIVDVGWPADDIAAAAAFLGRRRGVWLRLGGRLLRVHELRRILGPPDGRGPGVGPFTVEFDCADARVSMFRANRAGRLAMRLRDAVTRFSARPEARPAEYVQTDDAQ